MNMNNVGKTMITHPFGNGLYHLFMVIWGMVYYCFTLITVKGKNGFLTAISKIGPAGNGPILVVHHNSRGSFDFR